LPGKGEGKINIPFLFIAPIPEAANEQENNDKPKDYAFHLSGVLYHIGEMC